LSLSSGNAIAILNPSILKIYIDMINEEERRVSVLTPLSLPSVKAVGKVNVLGDINEIITFIYSGLSQVS
jgi:hypothetical protein